MWSIGLTAMLTKCLEYRPKMYLNKKAQEIDQEI